MNKSITVVISCLTVAAAYEDYDTTEMPVESTTYSVFDNYNNEGSAKPYNFHYKVKNEESRNDYYHSENFDETVINGEYAVQLPDGRLQIVTYHVDSNGYVAQVKYEGEAQYPEIHHNSISPV